MKLTVTTNDGLDHHFEGSRKDIAGIRESLRRLDAGMDVFVRLVNREGTTVMLWRGSTRSVR